MDALTQQQKLLLQRAQPSLMAAVSHDKSGNIDEALKAYAQGIKDLSDILKGSPNSSSLNGLRQKVNSLCSRHKELQEIKVARLNIQPTCKEMFFRDGETGHTFSSIFGPYLDVGVTCMKINDPYIRQKYQIELLINLIELARERCKYLNCISLITGQGDAHQHVAFNELKTDLKNNHKVDFSFEISNTIHDREIRLDNGYIITLGRGLDMFKKSPGRFILGATNQYFKHVYETKISVYHTRTLT